MARSTKLTYKCKACGAEYDDEQRRSYVEGLLKTLGPAAESHLVKGHTKCIKCGAEDVEATKVELEQSRCLIATAAYGSPFHPSVCALRRWRDHTLRRTAAGRLFVKAYYAASPLFVPIIRRNPWARRKIRGALDRLVAAVTEDRKPQAPDRTVRRLGSEVMGNKR
ncbi:MAG: CFI-box-CTERM domain-containing protein [Planctomycetota bacterium]